MINNTIIEDDYNKIIKIRILIYLLYRKINQNSKQKYYEDITLYKGCVLEKKEFSNWL